MLNGRLCRQQRFKATVERHGFRLEGGKKVVGGPADITAPLVTTTIEAAPPKVKQGRKRKDEGETTAARKKRKIVTKSKAEADEDAQDPDADLLDRTEDREMNGDVGGDGGMA